MSSDGSNDSAASSARLGNILNGLSVAHAYGSHMLGRRFGNLGPRVNAALGSTGTPLSVASAMTSSSATDVVGAGAGLAANAIDFATMVAPRVGRVLGFTARFAPGLGHVATAVSLHQLAMNHPGYAGAVQQLADVGRQGLSAAMSHSFSENLSDASSNPFNS